MALMLSLMLFGAQGGACDSIRAMSLPNTTITSVQLVAAGPSGTQQQPGPVLPEHCRVAAVLKPSSDSNIEMELWLPTRNWNGKFLAVGNGSWAGSISVSAVAEGVAEGYAAASTDTGHKGDTAEFAIGHPEKLTDFAYRSIHEMTLRSKEMIQRFYNRAPARSYFNGCSTGGWQGMAEAQRYPTDFDAMILGAPVYRRIHLHAQELQKVVEVTRDPQNRYVPPDKIQMVAKAVTAACDANDGVTDGLIENPQVCRFDPKTLACGANGGANCLTPGQVTSLERIYADTRTSTGQFVYPGHARGFELGWRMPEPGGGPRPTPPMSFAHLGHGDKNWDWKTFDLDKDLALAVENGGTIEATNPDLSAFRNRGGKIIMYHGWNDPGPSPLDTIRYHDQVRQRMGNQDSWFRLFLMPGMGHCGGGAGPDQANFLGALERWVESGIAPDRITAAKVTNRQVTMTRPLCPYPQVAKWKGVGSTNDAENFVCAR
jgi:feruloyl esterase